MKSKPKPPAPVVKSKPPAPKGPIEFVIRVGMKEKPQPEEIIVYQGDKGKDICNDFCQKHNIKDPTRKLNILKVIERQIEEHRSPKIEVKAVDPPVEELKPKPGKAIHPDIRRRVLEVFNEVWYDYDEEWGRIEMDKYKEIMRFVKVHEKFPDLRPEDDPFSDQNLEKAYQREE